MVYLGELSDILTCMKLFTYTTFIFELHVYVVRKSQFITKLNSIAIKKKRHKGGICLDVASFTVLLSQDPLFSCSLW